MIKESLIARKDLPAVIVEKLVTIISAEAAQRLYAKHEIPLDLAVDLAGRTRERATVDFITQSWVRRDLHSLISRLDAEDRLTTTLIVRAACCGQMRFCEHALAQKSGVNPAKAALMVHDGGPFGLKALCEQAGLGARDFAILRASLVIYKDLEAAGAKLSREKYQSLMLERVLSLPITFSDADTDYLLEKLDAVSAITA